MTKTKSKKLSFHQRYMLKKIGRAVKTGQKILHISNKQEDIEELLKPENFYTKQDNFENLDSGYSQIIFDLDMAALDDFAASLDLCKKILFKNGTLIVIATDMCSWRNKINFLFENKLEGINRPNRAVSAGFIRQSLLEKGFLLKNRAWKFENKIMVIACQNHGITY